MSRKPAAPSRHPIRSTAVPAGAAAVHLESSFAASGGAVLLFSLALMSGHALRR